MRPLPKPPGKKIINRRAHPKKRNKKNLIKEYVVPITDELLKELEDSFRGGPLG